MTATVEAKTSELAGAALDWAVAKADGEKLVEVEGKHSVITGFRLNPIHVPGGYTPSTDWNQGGPFIFVLWLPSVVLSWLRNWAIPLWYQKHFSARQ